MSAQRGVLLALDGLDGAGKTTQCRLLVEWLRSCGHAVTACTDPGGTALGNELRRLLLDYHGAMALACEAFLFMASRAQLVAEVIRPALAAGQLVVADRFVLANVVYQGHAGGLDPEELWRIGRLSTEGLEPDLTLVLDLQLSVALARRGGRGPHGGQADRLERRGHDFFERVRQGFLVEARRRPERIRVLDASGSVEAVHQQIRQEVARVLAASPRA